MRGGGRRDCRGKALRTHGAQCLRRSLTEAMRIEWMVFYQSMRTPDAYCPDAVSEGKRGLKNLALCYVIEIGGSGVHLLAQTRYANGNNIINRLAALSALANSNAPGKEAALTGFYADSEQVALVIDKWIPPQALARAIDAPRCAN